MRNFSRFILFVGILIAIVIGVTPIAHCQEANKYRFSVEASYNRTDIPAYNEKSEVENVNGFTLGANVNVLKFNKGDISVAYNFRRKLNQEVFPMYFDGMHVVDLYRDVDTHSVGAEARYFIFFAGLYYGSRKIHENAPYQLVRYVRFGVKVPTGNRFYIKGYLDYEQPYGQLPMGFVNPYNRTLGFGGGVRF